VRRKGGRGNAGIPRASVERVRTKKKGSSTPPLNSGQEGEGTPGLPGIGDMVDNLGRGDPKKGSLVQWIKRRGRLKEDLFLLNLSAALKCALLGK